MEGFNHKNRYFNSLNPDSILSADWEERNYNNDALSSNKLYISSI